MIAAAHEYGIAARVIGWVEEGGKKELVIELKDEQIVFSKREMTSLKDVIYKIGLYSFTTKVIGCL